MKKIKLSLGGKLTVLIIIVAVVLSVTAAIVSYNTFKTEMTKYYNQTGGNLVKTLASELSAEELTEYFESQEMDGRYFEIQEFIERLAENNDVEYLYVVKPHGVGVTFLFDSDMETSGDGNYEDGGYCALGTYVDLEGAFYENLPKLLKGEHVDPITQHDSSYGWLMTAMQPVMSDNGDVAAYVMADISMNDVVASRQNFLILLVILLAALTAVFVLASLLLLRRIVVTPINQLTAATDAFIENNQDQLASGTAAVTIPEIRTGDEVEQLANAFGKMQADILTYIHDLVTMTAEKERIGAELGVATQIQTDMLPRIFPPFPDRREFDVYATMTAAKEVGGDFYDFFLIDDDHLAVIAADVSGKSVPAALFMVIAKTIIKNHAQNGQSPASVFTLANDQLCEGNSAGFFVTAWLGVLEISTGDLRYVNAGHNPPLLKRSEERFEWLRSKPGLVLAAMEGVKYREETLELKRGDRLFLYTDGVTEAMNEELEQFGEQRLLEALNSGEGQPLKELLRNVKQRIDDFAGEMEQADDITMMLLEYRKDKGDGEHD